MEAVARVGEEMTSERYVRDDCAISVRGVTVAYRAYNQRPTSLKESLIHLMTRGRFSHYSTFDALQDVSFEVPRGSVFGIIGSNGCGKSTLLKVLAGVLRPVRGSATVRGEIASLIELGAGFDPELSAVENVFLNGSLHRRSRAEMAKRLPHILDFAELHEFAHTPVKYFSSGMYARLGFAVAVDIDPDILIVDEILAVGDERFQSRCMESFDRFIASGKTIVIVTHDMGMVESRCEQVLLLEKGRVRYVGDAGEAIELYRKGSYQTALT